MALPQNRNAVLQLKSVLEGIIVVPRLWLPGEKPCVCERSHGHGSGRAKAIVPGGGSHPGLEAESWSWDVVMEPIHPGEGTFTAALHQFVKRPVLEALFQQYFPHGRQPDPYRLEISSQQRYERRLPAAVRISRTSAGITFVCDWGKEQRAGRSIFQLSSSAGMVDCSDRRFSQVHSHLQHLLPDVFVYPGGPEPHPDHPWEVEWVLDFAQALEEAATMRNVYLYDQARTFLGTEEWYTTGTVWFGQ